MKKIETTTAPSAIGPYSQGIVCGDLVYTSGQCGFSIDGTLLSGGIGYEAEQAIINVGSILKAAGSDYDKVIKTTCYLTNMNDFAEFNRIYEKYFVSKPARSCVTVKALPKGACVEIEAVASLK